jgi:hypothetical protein
MTITLTPDIANALQVQAQKQGTTPQHFVLKILRERLALALPETTTDSIEPPADAWEAMLQSVASPAGVSLSDEATSRESLYD